MSAFMEAMGIEAGRYRSLREVEDGRPRLKTLAGVGVKTMRDERDAGVSGHERPKKLGPIFSWGRINASHRRPRSKASKPSTSRPNLRKPLNTSPRKNTNPTNAI